jgi:hypothetical protein
MSTYIYSVKTVKYGTPTGTNTMPESLVTLPDTVKGTVAIDESEGSTTQFFVDQKKNPIKSAKIEEGQTTVTMQFYDMDTTHLAAFKGGTRVTGGGADKFVPSTGYTTVEKALQIEFDSGHKFNMFNAACVARLMGGGGRDKMLSWELKATVQVTADLAGDAEYGTIV